MKKILSLTLAIVFMFALAIPAFAADNVNAAGDGTFTDKTAQVTATYTVSGAYTIEIPANFDLTVEDEASVATATKSVAVSNVLIPSGKKLTVTMTSANFAGNKFYLVCDTESKISYTITNDGTEVNTNGATIISVNAGTKAGDTAALVFTANYTEATYMGAHTDQLTFVASVD